MDGEEQSPIVKLVSAEGHEFFVDRKYFLLIITTLSLLMTCVCNLKLDAPWFQAQ